MATTKRAKLLDTAARARAAVASPRDCLNTTPRSIALAVATAFMPWFVPMASAQIAANTLPSDGQKAFGGVTWSSSGSKMDIVQSTDKAGVNWRTFSIGSDAWVNVAQPGAASVLLNRVVGNDASQIFGRLTANGQVFLVNGNGVFFSPSASVNVGALFASTLSISDQDFLAGRYQFFNAGNAGSVVNQGHIVTADGYTALVGPQVRNDGVIIARRGSVVLAAADRVSLDMIGDGLISLSVDQATLNASVINTGRIEADGGMVLLAARSANALLDTVINNSGIIRANSLVERSGEIVLDGGGAGVVANSGTLQAAGTDAGTTGGTVKVLGQYVGLLDGTRIDASGVAGGGRVLIGGNFQGSGPEQNASETFVGRKVAINADAGTSGDGGTVIVWADDATRFYGSISAKGGAEGGNGGFAEVSGKQRLGFDGFVSLAAPHGRTGTLLLDPDDLYIGADPGGGAVSADASLPTFNANNGADDFFVTAAAILAAGDVSFDLQAAHDVIFNAPVAALTGAGNTFAVAAGNAITMGTHSLTTAGGDISFSSGAGGMSLNALNAAGGTISATSTGGISLSGLIQTTNATTSAVVINAGSAAAAGTAAGGDVTITGGSFNVLAGRVTLFTGSVAGSTGLETLVGSASGNFRYNSDEAASNYSAALGATGSFAVYREQPLLSISVTSPTTKTYGTNDPGPQSFTVTSGYVNGDSAGLSGNFGRDPGEAVGSHAITTGTLQSDVGYGFSFSQSLSILAADVTATVNATKTYGTSDPTLATVPVVLTGLVNTTVTDWNGNNTLLNDSALTSTATALTRTAGETVAGGPYGILTGSFTAPSTNYNAPTLGAGSDLTITAANLSATVNANKVYGTDDPALGTVPVVLTGLVNATVTDWNGNNTLLNDSALTSTATALTRTAGETVAGGPYGILTGSFTAPSTNYNAPTLGAGSDLTITAANLSATVNANKVYGTDDPALGTVPVVLTGLVNATVTDWNGNNTLLNDSALTSTATALTRTAGETVAGAPYGILTGSFTAPSSNYNAPTLGAGSTLDITEANLTATVANQVKVYGADDPSLASVNVTLGGLVNRTVSTWNGNVVVDDSALSSSATSLTRAAGENVAGAPYAITAGTFTTPSTNYNAPTLVAGSTLDITEANLTATVANQIKVYGADDPTLASVNVTLGGLINRTVSTWNGNVAVDDSALTSTASSLTRAAGENVSGAPYAITAGTFTTPSTNYNAPTLVAGSTLNITPRTVNLAATREYDGSDDFTAGGFTPTITGTVANTSWSDWNGNVTNVVGGQTLTIASGTGTVPSDDVNPSQTLTTGTLTLGNGGNGGIGTNYTLAGGTHVGTITRRASVTWTGAGDGVSWSDPANWGGAIPDLANVSNVNLGASNVTFTSTVPALAGSVQVDNISGGALIMGSGTLAVAGSSNLTGYGQSGGTLNTGSMAVSSAAAINQTGGGMSVAGTSSFNAGGNPIALIGVNDFAGPVSLTGGTTQITDVNALTLGTVNVGGLTTINTGALNLGTLNASSLNSTTNGGNVTQTGAVVVSGATSIQAGGGSILLSNPSNDFGGTVQSGGTGGIALADSNTLTLGGLDAGSSVVTLAAGSLGGAGVVTGGSGTFVSNTNVLGLGIDIANNLHLDGSATLWNFSAGSDAGSFSVANANISVQIAGVTKVASVGQQQAAAAIGNVAEQIGAVIVEEANKTFGTDSVAEDVEYGFAGEIGATPPMDHRIDESGISLPRCVEEAREGLPCK